ncbi:hypothetical protein GCM10027275_19470 [Rhabdobacter roseus]|uniref:GNAT family N-acetyltransferase n=1 Tax=Rhabdobacter roseus TaxID=1655419 RepID=A0A840TRL5_9BACT|nr:GNAT family N-acetyltransferase [Rhabdobacter roseus]MBB5283873.1 hypothetical protein [Rhabdobacter roseus]
MPSPVLLSRSQIDDARWDRAIALSAQRVVYGYAWYLDVVAPDWMALAWPSADDYQVVMPLPLRRKWGLRVVQQPFFCQYLGPFSQVPLTPEMLSAFLAALGRSFSYISSYAFHPAHTPLLHQHRSQLPNYSFRLHHTYWLNLKETYLDLKQKYYHEDRRKNLKRAQKYTWERVEDTTVEPLIGWFRTYHAPGVAGGVSEAAYGTLRQLYGVLQKKNCVRVSYARRAGTYHGGIMVVEEGNQSTYLFNAADATGRQGNARTYLLDRYFEEKAATKRFFDFESPDIDSIAQFYRSFGAEQVPFYSLRRNALPFPLRVLQEWRVRRST